VRASPARTPHSDRAPAERAVTSLPSPITQEALAGALRPAIASKQYGYEDTLAALVAEAALAVMPRDPKAFNVDNVRVVKIMGGALSASRVVQGMVFGREPEGDVTKVEGAKVAVYTSALDVAQSETKGTVLIKNKDEMLNFTTGEEKHMEKVRAAPDRLRPPARPADARRRSSRRSRTRACASSWPARPSASSRCTT
jgi:chaperonin GroEL (HSP60 family)